MKTYIAQQSGLNEIDPYKPGRPIEEVQRQYGLEAVIKLASNENQFGASPLALQALQKALPTVNFYPDGQCFELRKAIAGKFGVSQEMVTVSNGADGIIQETCMAYLDNDSEVITSKTSFPMYDIFTRVMRAKIVKTPLTPRYSFDLDAILRAVTDRTKIIFICNPNNPTGTILCADEIDQFVNSIPENILIVFDEAYHEYVNSDEYPDTIEYVRQQRPNILVMRTFSKIYGLAGLRIGYGIGLPELLTPLNTIKEPFAVNRLAQVAGSAALEDVDFIKKITEQTIQGREFLYREMDRLGFFYVPSFTNFILVQFGPEAAHIIQKLTEMGVIIRPGKEYGLPEFARVTIGTPEQNRIFVSNLESIVIRAN